LIYEHVAEPFYGYPLPEARRGDEVLPWDVWGAQPAEAVELSQAELAFFDEIALLTADPDANFDALQRRFAEDGRLRLPDVVFDALRRREERVFDD
jgi:hypothetical protein